MEISVAFSPELKKIAKAFKSSVEDVERAFRNILETAGFTVERYSKQLTPVRTGRLRASIGIQEVNVGLHTVRIGTDTSYAFFVHEGTRFMRGRPFMREGARFAKTKLEGGEIKNTLDKELRRAFIKL